MKFGRKLRTKEEKEKWEKFYAKGMENNWCNGEYARLEGKFISEEDRLNKNSVAVIDDIETLRQFFIHGNWCLGCSAIYKNLCFINRINGGDEWLTLKYVDGEAVVFDSVTFRPTAKNYWDEDEYERRHLQCYLDIEERGKSKKYYKKQKYFEKYIEKLLTKSKKESYGE
jgi:hypothetical protein